MEKRNNGLFCMIDSVKRNRCSFFGHRKIKITEQLKNRIKLLVEDLIINHNVCLFLFGSRSEFNDLCYFIVTELKDRYCGIKRVFYSCKSEICILESEKKKYEKIYNHFLKDKTKILFFDEEFEYKGKYISGRASYIERNYAMIDDSDFCIFYYDKSYKPDVKKYSKNSIDYYQPKSGTALAYMYANQKSKVLFNVI